MARRLSKDGSKEKILGNMPQVFLSNRDISSKIAQALKNGEIQKIGPRLYTTDAESSPSDVIKRNLWVVIGLLFPHSVIAHRTALEIKPTTDGTVFLSAPYARTIHLPGHTIRLIEGPGPQLGDSPFIQDLWIASKPRALLENLRPTRNRSGVARAISRTEIERLLERTMSISGPSELNTIRDAARMLAINLDAEHEFAVLDDIIGTLIGTRSTTVTSPTAIARIAGRPYDADRLPLFDALIAELRQTDRNALPEPLLDETGKQNIAFVDAYFSNYIEGTEFEIEEAIEIVFESKIPQQRPQDAHDVLGTYRLLVNEAEMTHSASEHQGSFDDFIALLKRRHSLIMEARPDIHPGEFKTEANRAGGTSFVVPELVLGTLEKGFAYFHALETAFDRAVFMMFLVAEVHPFSDGNGRVARVMMNAELAAGKETRIIIPTVYRDSYIQALRNLSREMYAVTIVETLDFAQRFTSLIDFRSLPRTLAQLTACNAFLSSRDDRLLLPDSRVVVERLSSR